MWINCNCEFTDKYQSIPEPIQKDIKRYVEDRKIPSACLSAIIAGDLYGAVRLCNPELTPGIKNEKELKALRLYEKNILLIAQWFDSHFPHLTGIQNYRDWIVLEK